MLIKLKTHPLRFLLKPFLQKELYYFRNYSPLREKTQSLCFMWVELSRLVISEIQRRTGCGDELFELKVDELQSYFLTPPTRSALLERGLTRKKAKRFRKNIFVPHVLSSEGLDLIDRPEFNNSQTYLTGDVVCPGAVEGIARVVRDLSEAHEIKRGEILVTSFTDPSWTPLFLIASGLILEQGSSFSHGAIVAREFGLPALVNVSHATHQIKSGNRILLDANTGKVQILA